MPETPDVVVLCGGAGLRLRSVVGAAPKSMAEVAGRPFLELLLRQISRHGFGRAILAVGYQRDSIRMHFGDHAFGLDLVYSEEIFPLGTGGALRNAVGRITSDNVLVMNGDSYTNADLTGFLNHFRETVADAGVVVVPADSRSDCGFALLDGDGRMEGFNEKQAPLDASYVNAGIYLLSRQLLLDISAGEAVSLERELLPRWLREGRNIQGFVYSGPCIDIGTPERFNHAQSALADVETQDTEVCIPQRSQR